MGNSTCEEARSILNRRQFLKSKKFIVLIVAVALLFTSILIYRGISVGIDKAIRKIIQGIPIFLGDNLHIEGIYDKKMDAIKKTKSNCLFVCYKDLNGLRNGDKIKYKGKTVGYAEIFWINPEEDKRYEVLLKFRDRNFKVKKNSKFYIRTLGLGNEKYIEIVSNENEKEYIKRGSHVKGEESETIPLILPPKK